MLGHSKRQIFFYDWLDFSVFQISTSHLNTQTGFFGFLTEEYISGSSVNLALMEWGGELQLWFAMAIRTCNQLSVAIGEDRQCPPSPPCRARTSMAPLSFHRLLTLRVWCHHLPLTTWWITQSAHARRVSNMVGETGRRSGKGTSSPRKNAEVKAWQCEVSFECILLYALWGEGNRQRSRQVDEMITWWRQASGLCSTARRNCPCLTHIYDALGGGHRHLWSGERSWSSALLRKARGKSLGWGWQQS